MLDLDRGMASVAYTMGGVRYTREIFVSHPAQVMVIRLTASRPGRLSFTCQAGQQAPLPNPGQSGVLVLAGKAPAARSSETTTIAPTRSCTQATSMVRGMTFECHLRAIAEDGKVSVKDDSIRVDEATECNALALGRHQFPWLRQITRPPGCRSRAHRGRPPGGCG